MTENQEIILAESVGILRAPQEVLKSAREAAKALAEVVAQKPKPLIINGEQYLEYEDWQTVGHFYGLHAKTEDAVFVEVHGIEGAKARASIINRDGIIIGGAEAYCLRDEDKWKNKPWFQLASMAQTRAASKAFSNTLRWVVVLAGYKGTPAEEMADEKPATIPLEHWCAEHKTQWFKGGKMKGFAHKLTDGSWCNEPEPVIASAAKQSLSPLKGEGEQPAKEALFPPDGEKVIPQGGQAASPQTGQVAGKPFANVGDFLNAAMALGYKTKAEIAAALEVSNTGLIKDLDAAYRDLVILKGRV